VNGFVHIEAENDQFRVLLLER